MIADGGTFDALLVETLVLGFLRRARRMTRTVESAASMNRGLEDTGLFLKPPHIGDDLIDVFVEFHRKSNRLARAKNLARRTGRRQRDPPSSPHPRHRLGTFVA